MSTTLTLTPRDDRGQLDRAVSVERAHRARSWWINAQGAPADGYETALDRLAADWREHLSASL